MVFRLQHASPPSIVISYGLLLSMHVALLLPHSMASLTLAESTKNLHPHESTAGQQSSLRLRDPLFDLADRPLDISNFNFKLPLLSWTVWHLKNSQSPCARSCPTSSTIASRLGLVCHNVIRLPSKPATCGWSSGARQSL